MISDKPISLFLFLYIFNVKWEWNDYWLKIEQNMIITVYFHFLLSTSNKNHLSWQKHNCWLPGWVWLTLPVDGGEELILGISQHSHLFKAGWFRRVQAEQLHCSPSPSESPDPVGGCWGGAGGMAWIRGGKGGGGAETKIEKQIFIMSETNSFIMSEINSYKLQQ